MKNSFSCYFWVSLSPQNSKIHVITSLMINFDPFVESVGFIFMTDLYAHYILSHLLNP